MDGTALVLTNGILDRHNAKTAHGLIRGTERFEVLGIIDHNHAGGDAGVFLDGAHRGIPIYETLALAIEALGHKPDFVVIGVATHGGVLTDDLKAQALEALELGISLVNGLHGFAKDESDLSDAAMRTGATIVDVRCVPERRHLNFWNGKIFDVRAPRIAVLGTDCAIGKRTTCRFLMEGLRERSVNAEMIYTGQTGWMQGSKFGFIFDSVPNDFVCGEMEQAIWSCDRELNPDVILLEGQSSLRNPSGPAGSELLVSAAARGVVLQHAPGRSHFEGYEEMKQGRIPSLAEEIQLISLYGSRVIAIALNGDRLDDDGLTAARERIEREHGIIAAAPLLHGMAPLLDAAEAYIESERARP